MFDSLCDERDLLAVTKVDCPRCTAPAGSHCAAVGITIIWPPHLCRMDAYTHRLDESEDWPLATAALGEPLQHVRSVKGDGRKRLLWKEAFARRMVKTNEFGAPLAVVRNEPKHHDED